METNSLKIGKPANEESMLPLPPRFDEVMGENLHNEAINKESHEFFEKNNWIKKKSREEDLPKPNLDLFQEKSFNKFEMEQEPETFDDEDDAIKR